MDKIKLTKGLWALVDDEEYDNLLRYRWHAHNGYAARVVGPAGRQVRIYMQNQILKVVRGVDHIDRNGLNNQRDNLRVASKSLQGHNRLMPKRELPRGVSLHKGKYQASIRINHRLVYLGRFDTIEEAERVYLERCMVVHGELPPRWER